MATTQSRSRLDADQFFALPDDGKRYELVDGELIEMTTPNIRHQRIAWRLGRLIFPEVSKSGGEVFCPGVGIVVSKKVVQVPDLVVLTRPLQQAEIDYGLTYPPDLVVEILSASTAKYDRTVKSGRYAALGIPELWLVSPEAEIIEVLVLAGSRYQVHARVGRDEPITSAVIPSLSFPVSEAFRA